MRVKLCEEYPPPVSYDIEGYRRGYRRIGSTTGQDIKDIEKREFLNRDEKSKILKTKNHFFILLYH